MSDQKDSGGFLNRWSARKQQSARPVAGDASGQVATAGFEQLESADSPSLPATEHRQAELPGNDERVTGPLLDATAGSGHDALQQPDSEASVMEVQRLLTDGDMPAVETLTASSDISGFFSKGVSAALRKAALRHVFRQPSFNVRDGLDDYDGDYTTFEPLGDTVTADMKFHAAREARTRLEAEHLAAEQAQLDYPTQSSAETALDDTSSMESEQTSECAEELDATAQEDMPGDAGEAQQHAALMAENDSRQAVNPAHDRQRSQSPVADDNLNQPVRTTAPQLRETPNE